MSLCVVMEKFPHPHLIVDEETGEAKLFETVREAKEEADKCQDGQVIPLTQRINNLNRKSKVK